MRISNFTNKSKLKHSYHYGKDVNSGPDILGATIKGHKQVSGNSLEKE